MNTISRKAVRWTATAAYALIVLYLSVMSTSGESPFPYFDLIVHFVMYFGLAIFLTWSLRATFSITARTVVAISFIVATLYGFMNETIQLYIPSRDFEYSDLIANSAGAIAGSMLMVFTGEGLDEGENGMEDIT